jgi:hypothetical protein
MLGLAGGWPELDAGVDGMGWSLVCGWSLGWFLCWARGWDGMDFGLGWDRCPRLGCAGGWKLGWAVGWRQGWVRGLRTCCVGPKPGRWARLEAVVGWSGCWVVSGGRAGLQDVLDTGDWVGVDRAVQNGGWAGLAARFQSGGWA